jgi:hypothetical protein
MQRFSLSITGIAAEIHYEVQTFMSADSYKEKN